jgi:uncharacterized protein YkwD
MRPTTLTATAVAALALAASPVPASATPGARLRQLINDARAQHGLRPLRAERHLARAARGHSADMRRRRYFAHDSPEGTSPAARMRAAGYRHPSAVSETIAWGTGSERRPKALLRAWLHSPPHRAALLSPRFREIGVGVVRAHGQAWATADLGARR